MPEGAQNAIPGAVSAGFGLCRASVCAASVCAGASARRRRSQPSQRVTALMTPSTLCCKSVYVQWSHPRSGSAPLAGWQCSCITDRPVRLAPEALTSEQALTHSHSRTALSLAAAAEGLGGTDPGKPRRSTSCVQLHCVCGARTAPARDGAEWAASRARWAVLRAWCMLRSSAASVCCAAVWRFTPQCAHARSPCHRARC